MRAKDPPPLRAHDASLLPKERRGPGKLEGTPKPMPRWSGVSIPLSYAVAPRSDSRTVTAPFSSAGRHDAQPRRPCGDRRSAPGRHPASDRRSAPPWGAVPAGYVEQPRGTVRMLLSVMGSIVNQMRVDRAPARWPPARRSLPIFCQHATEAESGAESRSCHAGRNSKATPNVR
jgi:hypothetical protein